ncbi:hypothetical protein Tco_1514970 [Tanacetum coccineum]
MSSSTHPITILSDSNVEDAFSSTNTLDYTPASPDYFPASPGNTPSDSSDDLNKYLLASLAISPFHDDPYMKVMQAYNATSNELPIFVTKIHVKNFWQLHPSVRGEKAADCGWVCWRVVKKILGGGGGGWMEGGRKTEDEMEVIMRSGGMILHRNV